MQKRILGKFTPLNTLIHRLDPRMKILAMIMLVVLTFLPFQSYALTLFLSLVNLLIVFILMIIARVKLIDILIQLKSLWFMVLLLLIINVFLPPSSATHVLFTFKNFKVYTESLLLCAKVIIRLIAMFGVAAILTCSTSPQDITFGFSFYLRPLKKIKFPSEEVAMTMSIALRFIPTLLEETNRIYKAQSSRGVDFKHGNLKAKFKGLISLVIPLFVSAFTMSDDLALSLEARGYNPKAKRSSYKIHHWRVIDTMLLLLCTLYLGGLIALSISKYDFVLVLFPNLF